MTQRKGQGPDMNLVGGDPFGPPPPSYVEATITGSRPGPISPGQFQPHPVQNSVETLLRRLPSQVRKARHDQLSHEMDDEHLLVEHLIPYITEFLRNLPASFLRPKDHRRPLSAELVLLPENTVPAAQGWLLSGLDQRREQAGHVQVVEVASPETKLKSDCLDQKKPDASYETLGENKRDLMWWRDEDLADRLAFNIKCYLEHDKKAEPELHSSADYDEDSGLSQKHEDGFICHSGFAPRDKSPGRPASLLLERSNNSHASTSHTGLGAQPHSHHNRGTSNDTEATKATVQAEEVAFRRENDMGLWESSSGWAIVLTVTVTL